MATKHAAGTPVTGEYDSYTAEQLQALEEIKDRSFALGIAPAKYANHVLLPNGKIVKDVASLEEAAAAAHKRVLSGDLTSPAVLIAAAQAAAKLQEVQDHIAQKRFLFVVDADGLPVVYFQTATKNNPDLPLRATTKQHHADIKEAQARIATVIDTAHRAAKARAAQPKE
jgi:hypothetical protein